MSTGLLWLTLLCGVASVESMVVTSSLLRESTVTLGSVVVSRPRVSPPMKPIRKEEIRRPAEEEEFLFSRQDAATAAIGTLVGVAAHLPVAMSMAAGVGALWAAQREDAAGLVARGLGKAGVAAFDATRELVETLMESDAARQVKQTLESESWIEDASNQFGKISQNADVLQQDLEEKFSSFKNVFSVKTKLEPVSE